MAKVVPDVRGGEAGRRGLPKVMGVRAALS